MPIGPGGLDPNGIWQYGEDDSEALASDLLNLGMSSVSTALSNLGGGFDSSTTITASNASWTVPALGSPFVKVVAIGGGGGGNGSDGSSVTVGGAGGTTIFNAGAAGTITATGGLAAPAQNTVLAAPNGARSGNGGTNKSSTGARPSLSPGQGGELVVSYLDLTGISTVNVTVGAGGAGGIYDGSPGGRGEVIFEYVAG